MPCLLTIQTRLCIFRSDEVFPTQVTINRRFPWTSMMRGLSIIWCSPQPARQPLISYWCRNQILWKREPDFTCS